MNMIPSRISRSKHESLEVKEIDKGVYVFENAYDGRYEYFRGRPIADTSASESDATPSDTSAAANAHEGQATR
jgi:hypothetical protein